MICYGRYAYQALRDGSAAYCLGCILEPGKKDVAADIKQVRRLECAKWGQKRGCERR